MCPRAYSPFIPPSVQPHLKIVKTSAIITGSISILK
jgi:hypothetical protein